MSQPNPADSNDPSAQPDRPGEPGQQTGGTPGSGAPGNLGSYSQQFSHQPVAARVPDKVGKGVITTGVLVLDSPGEFVLDFLQGLTRPLHIAARVVVSPGMMGQLIQALTENLGKYSATYGTPPALPKPPAQRPTIQEIYENFKLAEELMSGVYANSVMIGHSAAEFHFDFITSFYPNAALSARIFTAAPHVPRILETLTMANQQFYRRYHGGKMPGQG